MRHLLEDHAPGWYTGEHQRASKLGLRQGGHRQAEAFLMLYDLLEEYAPRWYPSELHHGAEMAAERLKKVQGGPHQRCCQPGAIPEIDSQAPGR